jgi:hypothetical protein
MTTGTNVISTTSPNKKPPAWEALAWCFMLFVLSGSVQLPPGSPAGKLKKKKEKLKLRA